MAEWTDLNQQRGNLKVVKVGVAEVPRNACGQLRNCVATAVEMLRELARQKVDQQLQ